MKNFYLMQVDDKLKTKIAEGCLFSTGEVAVCWNGNSAKFYMSLEECMQMALYSKNILLEWTDDEEV